MCGLLYMVVTYLDLVVDGIKRARNYRFFVHADANVNGQIKKGAFAFCTRVAASAERRIVVMGPYFDQDEKDSSHDFYLDEGIMGAVNRHLQMGSQDFEYQRIVQMDQDVYESCRDEREFFAGALNNIGLAKHVAEVLDLASSHPTQGPKIEIFARPHVASFPSMLLVDDRFVFFSLPTELTRSGSRRTYDLVLGFEDVSGAMPKLLRSVVRKFAETDSTRIYNILPDQ